MAANLSNALARATGQKVELQLKDGRTLRGRLAGSDEHLNFVVDDAEEHAPTGVRRLGRLVVRGSNVASLHVVVGA